MRRECLLWILAAGCAAPAPDVPRTQLEREVRLALARTVPEARPSVWVCGLDGREHLAWQADRLVPSASTIKVLILVEAHAQAKAGTFRWTEETPVLEADRVGGSGSLRFERPGSTWTWLQIARRMILESDNVASNLMIRRLGMDRINARAAALGLEHTRLERLFMDVDARREGRENTTTASEMGRLMRAICRREVVGPEECDEMIALLERTSRGRIASGVPRDVPVGHKGGTAPALRADVGWVRLPGRPYVLSVYLDNVFDRPGKDETRGREAIEAVARAVYRVLGPSDE